MRVIIKDDPENVSDWVASYVKERIIAFNPTADRPFVLGLPTGSTPIKTYEKLVKYYKAGELSFEHIVTFNMDEYVGIPEDHPESYHSFMKTHLFDHVNIKPENIHIPNGNAKDLIKECDDYEKKIASFGGIELFLAGCGPNAHLGFSEAGSSLTSLTRIKTLAYDTIVANARFFDGDLTKVPKMALTVGVKTVMDAREVICIITGFHKAYALAKTVEGGVNHMYVCSALQQHPRAVVVCDDAATMELRVKTVRYFKGIQTTCEELNQLTGSNYQA